MLTFRCLAVLAACMAVASVAPALDVHQAVRDGNPVALKAALAKNPGQISEKDEDQNTPLHIACITGNIEIVKLLLGKKADIEAGDREASTPLHDAAQGGHLAVVKLLLDKGTKINAADSNGMTPLHFACYQGHAGVARLLLDRGADLKALTTRRSTPLHGAALYGHAEAARLLLDRGIDPAVENEGGFVPLVGAASGGSAELVRILLAAGGLKQAKYGTAALVSGAHAGSREIVDALLAAGVSPTASEPDGVTPLLAAVWSGKKDLVELFLDRGVPVDEAREGGITPLAAAARQGFGSVVELLLARGADVNRKDSQGNALLPQLVMDHRDDMVRTVLAAGALTNERDPEYGRTALHWAAIRGNRTSAEQLLDKGCDTAAEDNDGKRALYYAAKYGHRDVARLLEAKDAKAGPLEKHYGRSLLLDRPLKDGEALVWYLGHCGYAVKTRNHVLVFDYWAPDADRVVNAFLSNGHINPLELASENVTVFVTHGHGDHFDPVIFDWADQLPRARYIYGFDPSRLPPPRVRPDGPLPGYKGPAFDLIGPHQQKTIDGMDITTLQANDSGVGFLVKVDGVSLYHAGDHAGWREGQKAGYTGEIDYLAPVAKGADLAFLNVTGCHAGDPEALAQGTAYTLDKLRPKVWLPTHARNRESAYRKSAERAAKDAPFAAYAYPENPGDAFLYAAGAIRPAFEMPTLSAQGAAGTKEATR